MKGPFLFSVFVSVFVLAGCGGLIAVTSGQIGCAEDDIEILKDEGGWGARTWTASCHGKTYYCSAHGGGSHSTAQVSCKGAASQTASTAAPAAVGNGCQYDTQCKGDRICSGGQCVNPGESVALVPSQTVARAPTAVAAEKPTDNFETECSTGVSAACHALAVDHELGRNGREKTVSTALQYYDRACTLGLTADCKRSKLLRTKSP